MDLELTPAIVSIAFALAVVAFIRLVTEEIRVQRMLDKVVDQEFDKQRARSHALELREMFDVSEPEWHILNEMAGQKPYHVQNAPLRRIIEDWSKYEPDWVGCEAEPDPEIFALPPTIGTWQRRQSDELEEY